MKIFNLLFCFLFVISAILQYNDADPYIWAPIYLYGAVLCYLAARQRYLPIAYLIGLVCCLAYAGYTLFFLKGVTDWFQHHHTGELVQHMVADKPWIEETRELGGLLILASVLGINWLYSLKKSRETAHN